MKLFQDCEIVRQHLRGHVAVTIVGSRAATDDELASLAAEFVASFGRQHTPMYFSGGGWQAIKLQPAQESAPEVARKSGTKSLVKGA